MIFSGPLGCIEPWDKQIDIGPESELSRSNTVGHASGENIEFKRITARFGPFKL